MVLLVQLDKLYLLLLTYILTMFVIDFSCFFVFFFFFEIKKISRKGHTSEYRITEVEQLRADIIVTGFVGLNSNI